jgi:hypothetical protein
MNENGSQRPPLPRAAPILAIGVAAVLSGGFGLGIYVLRTPSAVLPPAAVLSPPPEEILPAIEPSPPEVSVPSPAIVPAPPPTPAAIPPEPPAPAIAPPPAVIVPAKPVAEPRPAKPVAEPRPVTPVVEPRHHRPAKPVLRHSAPRAAPSPHKPTLLPDHKHWAIRVGAFQSDDHAKLLVDTLKFGGYPARIIQQRDRGGRGWFVVQTQDYATRAEAQRAARLLTERVHVPTIIFERKEGG